MSQRRMCSPLGERHQKCREEHQRELAEQHRGRRDVDELLAWGLRNALHAPERDEPVHAEHVLNGTRVALDRAGPAPSKPTGQAFLGT